SFKVERFKKSYQIQTYDRIVAFMNGKEPNEVHSSNLRNLITSIYSFVLVVGIFIAVVLISIYLFKP
ncbi:XRE family transcriptional regulator, partial [Staphylococcus saprophyticus]|nr:XRE family transcriptional regulator [Staphylococcus saprophyticus]